MLGFSPPKGAGGACNAQDGVKPMGLIMFQSPEGGRRGLQPLWFHDLDTVQEFQSPEGGRRGLQRWGQGNSQSD